MFLVLRRQKGFRRTNPTKVRKALRTNIRPVTVVRYRPVKPLRQLALPLSYEPDGATARTKRLNGLRQNSRWYALLLFDEIKPSGETVMCGICDEPISSVDDLTIDHIIPLSRGGTNEQSNLQPAHAGCNWGKGSFLMSELKLHLSA